MIQWMGLSRAAERILGCRDAACDAVQEALITFWLHPPAHAEQRAWLVRTVVHRSLHQRRTRKRRRHWEGQSVAAQPEDCPICNPQRELEQREVAVILERALGALPEPYRLAFIMREVEGRQYEVIARQLDIPVGTVRSRLNRARAALRVHVRAALSEGGAC
jgi:RNA polymerase sigma-70 factor (ECF subfamily)